MELFHVGALNHAKLMDTLEHFEFILYIKKKT